MSKTQPKTREKTNHERGPEIEDVRNRLRRGILDTVEESVILDFKKDRLVNKVCEAVKKDLSGRGIKITDEFFQKMLSMAEAEYDMVANELAEDAGAIEKSEKGENDFHKVLEGLRNNIDKMEQADEEMIAKVENDFLELGRILEELPDEVREHCKIELKMAITDFEEKKEKIMEAMDSAEKDMATVAPELSDDNLSRVREVAEKSPPPQDSSRSKTVEQQPEAEKKHQEIENIDLPSSLLAELFISRQEELKNLMQLMYNRSLTEEHGERVKIYLMDALKDLFQRKPDEKIMTKLVAHGIEDWEEFQSLLSGKVGTRLIEVLNEMTQEQIKRDVAKNTSALERISAIKGQMIARIATNVALVTGGVVATSVVLSGLGVAATVGGIGMAAIGGGVGGFIRGVAQKFIFSNKKIEERKQRLLKELEDTKKKEMVDNIMENNFSETANFEQTSHEIGAIFAQVLRESKEVVLEKEPQEALVLSANARRQYMEALNVMKSEGIDPSERQKIELVQLLGQLQVKNEQKQAEAIKHSDPVVIRILDGVMKGYSGTHEKAGMWGSAVLGSGMGTAFFADSKWARGILGGIGGALSGYHFAEGWRTRKEEKNILEEINNDLQEAQAELGFMAEESSGLIKADFIEHLNAYLNKFRNALRGDGDKIYAKILKDNPLLRTKVENFVYEAEKTGAILEKEKQKNLAKILMALEETGEEIKKESEEKWGIKAKKWLKKTGTRALGMVGGAVAGATLAIFAGEVSKDSASEWKHIIFGHSYDEPIISPTRVAEDETKPVVKTEIESSKTVDAPERPIKIKEVVEPSPVVETKPVVSEAVYVEARPVVQPEIIDSFDLQHLDRESDLAKFFTQHHVTKAEFGYLDKLTENYPELKDSDVLKNIVESAEFHDGKHSSHPEVYKGTINTPIEAAADSKFATFDAILRAKGGGSDRAVEFLKLQNFNEYDLRENLKLTGSLSGSGLDDKLTKLVEAYQNGDNKAGKHIFDALRHDQNRALAQFEDAKGIIRIKGAGGHPRVMGIDEFSGTKKSNVLFGQVKEYGIGHGHGRKLADVHSDVLRPEEFTKPGNNVAHEAVHQKMSHKIDSETIVRQSEPVVEEVEAVESTPRSPKSTVLDTLPDERETLATKMDYSGAFGELEPANETDLSESTDFLPGTESVASEQVLTEPILVGSQPTHVPHHIPTSELWMPTATKSGSSTTGGTEINEQRGGGGVGEKVSEAVTAKGGGAGSKQTGLEQHRTSTASHTESSDFKKAETIPFASVPPTTVEKYVDLLQNVKNHWQNSDIIFQGKSATNVRDSLLALFDGQLQLAKSHKPLDTELVHFAQSWNNHFDDSSALNVSEALAEKMSPEQKFLLEEVVPDNSVEKGSAKFFASTDEPTHAIKVINEGKTTFMYDPKNLYVYEGDHIIKISAQTGVKTVADLRVAK